MAKAKKKDVAGFTADLMAIVKEMAKGNKALESKVADLEKRQEEVLGGLKTIGPCYACKENDTVRASDYEFKKAHWFMCPHKDLFCPDCLKKDREEARKKRKEVWEKEKKERDAKKGKK